MWTVSSPISACVRLATQVSTVRLQLTPVNPIHVTMRDTAVARARAGVQLVFPNHTLSATVPQAMQVRFLQFVILLGYENWVTKHRVKCFKKVLNNMLFIFINTFFNCIHYIMIKSQYLFG